jgi:hypothetical protein
MVKNESRRKLPKKKIILATILTIFKIMSYQNISELLNDMESGCGNFE